ncbi:hypothetical protein COHA_005491 [Chlorella ohadii]|uniref:Uncharacterized protein n=1 Tax=Chlorella ohadii TaxID=2649997 RepID=A0AAD5H5D6_9CHLO|nr:hypothetical protein COHA_005491 [Chlorella ohadii]
MRYRRFVDANQHLTQIDWLRLSLGMWPPQGVPVWWPFRASPGGYATFRGISLSRVAAMYNNFETAMLHPDWQASHLPVVWGGRPNGLAVGGTRRNINVNDLGIEQYNNNMMHMTVWGEYMLCLERERAAVPGQPLARGFAAVGMPIFPTVNFMLGYDQQTHIGALNRLSQNLAALQAQPPAAGAPPPPPTLFGPGVFRVYWALPNAWLPNGAPRPLPPNIESAAFLQPVGLPLISRLNANALTGYNV